MACLCAGVTNAELDATIAADPTASVVSLGATLGCGIQCGSCVPALKEALGEIAWFAASARTRPITRSRDLRGSERLIYQVEITLAGRHPYPVVQPGQHVVVRARTDDGVVERTYTVVAQDVGARRLTLGVRRNPKGRLTPWLLREGEARVIEVSVPGGPGLLAEDCQDHVFFAGGVGITPAVAMAAALPRGAAMHVDYSVVEAGDAAFLPRLDALCEAGPALRYVLRETSRTGPICDSDVRALTAEFPQARFTICGPAGYVEFVQRALRKAGVPRSRLHVELFATSRATALPRTSRAKAYLAGTVLMLLPMLVMLPQMQEVRPHGHPNVGHEQLKCAACHVESPASMRQALQAKVKHALGLRETTAVAGMQPVTTSTCVQCHANSDDPHAPHRFLEPRFEKARAETGAQNCVRCHREHSGVRVTVASTGYCVSCHAEMKVENDKTSPTHDYLVRQKRWDSCLQCHDYHGNHRWRAPLRLVDAPTVDVLASYLQNGPSPFGNPVTKAKQEGVQ
jgi:ferredoxin-NADP reductase/bacterioferritin-associated ferredoxin